MNFIKKYIVVFVFILALFLRFYNLGINPPALTWDEVSWGYNAYTLGQTGHDEFSKFLPITYLESFGDFKPPMYAYLSIIPIKMLGISAVSTRFVSALFGSVTVIVAYFLVLTLFNKSKYKKNIAILSAFLLAISPWHILLSRAAFEANVASFFITLGVYLFLLSTNTRLKTWMFTASLVSFVAAMYTFNTSRVFLPLFVPFLLILKHKVLLTEWKRGLLGLGIAGVLFLPLFFFLLTPQAKLRYQEVNIFSDIQVIERVNQEIKNDNDSLFSKVIHNRRLTYGVEYLKHYMDNLDPQFLFIKGDGNPKFSIQDVGQMYIWELPFLLVGAFLLFRKREGNWVVIPFWIVLGIVPAATARETPHALRIETIIPTFQILVAYGLVYSLVALSRVRYALLGIKLKDVLQGALGVTVFLCFLYFLHSYFVHYPIKYASEWQYGYEGAINFAEANKDKYKNIYVTEGLGRPYIYALYYGKYPEGTLKNAKVTREALGFVHVNSFGKYTFANELPFDQPNSLYINIPSKVPTSAHVIEKFNQPDGQTVLVAYER